MEPFTLLESSLIETQKWDKECLTQFYGRVHSYSGLGSVKSQFWMNVVKISISYLDNFSPKLTFDGSKS